jgi:hypothetical protein
MGLIREVRLRITKAQKDCPICLKPFRVEVMRNGHARLATAHDHDHETGVGRELICRDCNLGLGFFHDDTQALRRAAAYVGKHKAKTRKEWIAQNYERHPFAEYIGRVCE